MTPQELYRAGELGPAIKALGEELRSYPLDAKRRTFLFELLCFAGEFDRAEKHLDVLADQNPKHAAGTLLYRSALYAERTRQQMFRTGELPPADKGGERRPGESDGQRFASLADADPRIGDNLEVFIAGSYTWIPIRYVEELEIQAPETLRDLLWARARIQVSPAFRLQDLGEILLPVVAPLSYLSSDDAARLGRISVWDEKADGPDVLTGQKLLVVDGEEIPLLEFRNIKWDSVEEEPGGESVDASA